MPGNVREVRNLGREIRQALVEEHQKLLDQLPIRADGKGPLHYDEPQAAITAADASGLASSKTLAAAIATFLEGHATGETTGRHGAASTIAIAAWASKPAEPADLTEVQNILNECQTDLNTHFAVAGAHRWIEDADATAAASDQGSANTLANALKARCNKHRAGVRDIEIIAS